MRQIVIIGNSAAGVAAAESVRGRDKEAKIIIFSDEGMPATDRTKMLMWLEGKIKERELIYRNHDFYKEWALDLVLDSEVAGININKKKVTGNQKN